VDGAPVSPKVKRRETKEREGEAFDEAARQMVTSMVETLSKAETREGQRGLNAEIPRRLTARPLGWASREVRRSLEEGRSFERDSSSRKKRGKDSEIHAVKKKRKIGELPCLLEAFLRVFYKSTNASKYMKIISICQYSKVSRSGER
jgi:hypothetical protein